MSALDGLSDETREWIRRQAADAPPLNQDQRDKLAELLRPVRVGRSA